MSDASLEQRVAALEAAQAQAQAGAGGETVEAFLSGALVAYAASQQQGQQAQSLGPPSTGVAAQGLFGWNPTKYDSFFWCRSRFMCNPQSISCLC